jgi:hypothetical protein
VVLTGRPRPHFAKKSGFKGTKALIARMLVI